MPNFQRRGPTPRHHQQHTRWYQPEGKELPTWVIVVLFGLGLGLMISGFFPR